MLTEEQIKSLKQGDPLIIPGIFRRVDKEGDIWVNIDGDDFYFSPTLVSLPSEHGTSVPTPKYDPTRLFRKGDKVRVVRSKGRSYSKYWEKRLGQILTVTWSEDENTSPEVDEQTIDPSYLELITPVEELEPYFIYESKEEESFDIMKRDGKLYLTRNCIYYKSDINDHAELTREQAKAAAEAECKRLNEEHRKNQNND